MKNTLIITAYVLLGGAAGSLTKAFSVAHDESRLWQTTQERSYLHGRFLNDRWSCYRLHRLDLPLAPPRQGPRRLISTLRHKAAPPHQ